MTISGLAGCDKPGHPNYYSHDCRAWDEAIAKLPIGGQLSRSITSPPDVYAEVEPLPEGACSAEEFPVWMDGSQSHVRCELPKGHDGHHHGHFTDDGAEWDF